MSDILIPRLSGQTPILGSVLFVSKSLWGIEGHKKLYKITVLSCKTRSQVRIIFLYIAFRKNYSAIAGKKNYD